MRLYDNSPTWCDDMANNCWLRNSNSSFSLREIAQHTHCRHFFLHFPLPVFDNWQHFDTIIFLLFCAVPSYDNNSSTETSLVRLQSGRKDQHCHLVLISRWKFVPKIKTLKMELRREEEYSSIFRAKLCNLENTECRQNGQLWNGDEEGGELSPDRSVATGQSKFSILVHFFRIFLLVYHSVNWNKVMKTTGVSRQEKLDDFELCD